MFIILVILCIKLYNYNSWGICKCDTDMNGKTVVITGGNRGIGREIARILAIRKARVIIGCRNTKVAEHTIQELKRSDNIDIIAKYLDLNSFESVRNFAEHINGNETNVSVLICNAAIAPKTGIYQQDRCAKGCSQNAPNLRKKVGKYPLSGDT